MYKVHLSKLWNSILSKSRRRSSPWPLQEYFQHQAFQATRTSGTINTGQGACPQKKRFHYLPWNIAHRSIHFQGELSQEAFHPPVFLENIVTHVSFRTLASQLSRIGLSGCDELMTKQQLFKIFFCRIWENIFSAGKTSFLIESSFNTKLFRWQRLYVLEFI